VVHRPRESVADRTLGTAVVTGIRLARGRYVCVLDADGQHPPENIPDMISLAQRTSADYVGGSRYMSGGSAEGLEGIKRQWISRGLALIARLAFCRTPIRGITDPLSGFFLFRRQIVADVILQPIGWKISLEVLVRGRARRVTELPYRFAKRADGDSKASLQQGLLVLRHILVLQSVRSVRRRPTTLGLVGLSGVAPAGVKRAA
jgi:dolichol-phosphate mannosyltransferase